MTPYLRTVMLAAFIGLFGSANETLAASPGQVSVDTGRLQGEVTDGVVSFKGIPYAQPPVGELRWRAPQPAAKWNAVRSATTFGSDCMQVPIPFLPDNPRTTPNEDCLYLNVWAPAVVSSHKRPVMVWIYGGGFIFGSTSAPIHDGSQFAKHGVVLVSFNYRVGRFGFFAHPALTQESPDGLLGNYALMDQIAALQWVRRNIGAFGGDSNNVTIFGESAGGTSVHLMMASPLAKGLFHKTIVESGAGRSIFSPALPVHREGPGPSAEDRGIAFAKSVGVADEGSAGLAALRKLPAEIIRGDLSLNTMFSSDFVGPMIDGRIETAGIPESYQTGRVAKVPMIIGANSADGIPAGGTTLDAALAPFGDKHAQARALYDFDNNGDATVVNRRVTGDVWFIEPARFLARVLTKQGQRVYSYRFSYVADSMRKEMPDGAWHASEVPYVFDTLPARLKNIEAKDSAMARQIQDYWIAFAKTGDPNGAHRARWPTYDARADVLLDFAADGQSVAKPDSFKTRLDLAESVAGASP